ncbi:rcc01693 family protein [Shimia sediminis]|uniref:rcc01693 family protein n=1 Tax=Shimia sediminis TaxID=2497945 RepID=UPI000F8E0B75|nr:rcc01693 family protein [Shimia sediminis]
MSGFDWPALMQAGLVGLRLKPDEFWALSPAELRLMLGQGGAAPALTRKGLDALLAAYPDKKEEREDG